ncbi:MAG: IMP dehydrogenase [Lachnospirales bacterium]
MAQFLNDISRTFNEYLLIPSLSTKECMEKNVSLKTPITKFKKGETPIFLNIPITSAVMQAVSDDKLAIELARQGGLSFIFGSQSIEDQAKMIKKVKGFKAGFLISSSNLKETATVNDVVEMVNEGGFHTIAITSDGSSTGKLLGIVTSRDYRLSRIDMNTQVKEFMTPFNQLICGKLGISLAEANDVIWEHKLNALPIVDDDQNLVSIVFRKDYDKHKKNPDEILDKNKRFLVGAGINTHDYSKRIPALVEAGVDVLCIDSSDGFSEWQKDTIAFVREKYGETVKIGAGNVVDKDGFNYLADAGADFIKIGVGGGSICITREQKGIGRGQASAVIEVAKARDEYYEKTGTYIPICSDGGIVQDYHITLALAMGADFVMLGRYFARFDESPGRKYKVNGNYVKEYWGEGSNRARNWQRYGNDSNKKMQFEEGVDSFVPYAGSLKENVHITTSKIKSTLCNCGSLNIEDFQKNAKLTLVSTMSLSEGGAHDVIVKDKSI